jgi:hypothetical protein
MVRLPLRHKGVRSHAQAIPGLSFSLGSNKWSNLYPGTLRGSQLQTLIALVTST